MKNILLVLFLLIMQISLAQTVNVKWGTDFNKDGVKQDLRGDAKIPANADKDGNIVYVSSAVIAKCKELYQLPDNKYSTSFIQTPNHYYAITEAPGKIYGIEIDEKGNSKNRPIEVASFNLRLAPNAKWMNYTNGDYVTCMVSQNRQTLGTWAEMYNSKNNGFEKLCFSVFDENLKPLWSKEHDFSLLNNQISIEKKYVSNSGKVVFSAILAKDEKKEAGQKKFIPNCYHIFIATANNIKNHRLDLGDGFDVLTLSMTDIDDENMLLVGGYTTTGEASYTNGIFVAVLNLTSGSITIQSKTPFTTEVLENIKPRKDDAIYALKTELIAKSEAANYFVMMEEDKVVCSSNSCTQIRNGTVVVTLNKDLKVVNQTPVVNDYKRSEGNYFGTFPYIVNDKLFLLYNKNIENKADSRMQYTVLDLGGKIINHGNVPLSDDKYFFVGEPYPSLRLKDGRLVIGCSGSNANFYTPVFCRGVLTLH